METASRNKALRCSMYVPDSASQLDLPRVILKKNFPI